MTDEEKKHIISQIQQLTNDYFCALKSILEKNDLLYATECRYKIGGAPFDGIMPEIDNDMLENLCLEALEHPECVEHSLYEKAYVKKKIAEYDDYHSPKNRILRHMSEIARLKEKYNVSDEDLKDSSKLNQMTEAT